jgi:hypothetical protein
MIGYYFWHAWEMKMLDWYVARFIIQDCILPRFQHTNVEMFNRNLVDQVDENEDFNNEI